MRRNDQLAAGGAEVAEPAGQAAGVDDAQGVGADADVVLGVEASASGAAWSRSPSRQAPPPCDGPEELAQRAGPRSRPAPARPRRAGRC